MASSTENQMTGSTNPTANPHARVAPTPDNPRGYPSFNMERVLNYINNQIIYYYMIDAISVAELTRFHQLMKQRKVSLNLIGWDSMSNHVSEREDTSENTIFPHNYDNNNSNYPASLPGTVGIKISPSVIIQLKYNSTVAQYSNWLADLKITFNEDLAKFSTSY